MRRTMFVVPLELAAVMDAACTRALVPAERRRLIRLIEDHGFAGDGGAWLKRVADKTLAALAARGEATANELREGVAQLRRKFQFGAGKSLGGARSASPPGCCSTWPPGQDRAGPAPGQLDLEPVPLDPDRGLVRGRPAPARPRGGAGRAAAPLAAHLRSRHPHRHPLVERLNAAPDQDGFGGGGRGRGRARAGEWLSPPQRPRAAGSATRLGRLAARPRSHGDGLEGAGLVPGEPWSRALFDRNGNAGPTIWFNGRVVGGWAQRRDGAVAARILEPVPPEAEDRIAAEAERLTAFLGAVRVTPRFRTPLEKGLAG